MSDQSNMESPISQNPFAPELFDADLFGAKSAGAEPLDFPAALVDNNFLPKPPASIRSTP